MKINTILLLIYLPATLSKKNSEDSDIVFVFEHVRHGARSPLFEDNNTAYIDHFGYKWEGPGVLTSIGKRTHYILGIQNRIKYSSIINFSKLNSKEIQIFSTNSVRTLQSIQAELQAMYLPGTLEQLSDEELAVAYPPLQQIPFIVIEEIKHLNHSAIIDGINVFPIQFSSPKKLRLNEPENCPYMSIYQSELEKNIQDEINVFLKALDEKYGKQLQKYFNMSSRDFIYDFNFIELIMADEYICNYFQGSNFSDFIEKTGIDIEEFFIYTTQIKNFYIFNINIDEHTGVMAASPQMKDLINYMDNIIKDNNNIPKMVIHGGHDTTISYIQYFMQNVFGIPIRYIPFAANIYFELHKNGTNKYYVEYIFNGMSLLQLNYEIFKAKVLEAIWNEDKINKFCYQEEDDKLEKYKTLNFILIISNSVFAVLTVLFLSLFIYCCKKNKKSYVSRAINDSILIDEDKQKK